MSNYEEKPKRIYAPLNGKEITFSSGGSLLKLSGNAEKLIAFIKEHANEKGYINLKVERKREPDQYGSTHSVQLDQWKPSGQSNSRPANSNQIQRRQDDYRDATASDVPF